VLLGFFLAVSFTLELPWLLHVSQFHGAPTTFIAHVFDIYGDADRAYYEAPTPFTLCLEGINVWFTPILDVALMFAIVRRRPWRHALQLTLGSYLTYSVALYFLHAHVGGYADMRYHSAYTYALFYGVNLPWLLGHAWLAWDSFDAVTQRFRLAATA
jgi:hypothetical protein